MPQPAKPNPDERPEKTPERNVEAGVRDSFPASDPAASTASQGARAVPPQSMMDPDWSSTAATRPKNAVTVTERFPNAEAAKLALEALVRDGPVDRRCAEIRGTDLAVHAPPADAPRLQALLRRAATPHGSG